MRSFDVALAAAIVLALAAPAGANVHTTNYDPHLCLGETRDFNGPAFLDRGTSGKLKNVSSDTVNVYCPIVKKASGPGITVDALNYVDVPVTTSGGKVVACHVRSWRSNITYPQTWGNGFQNLISEAVNSTSTSTSGTGMRMQAPYGTPQDYWDGQGGSQTWPSWLYLDLMCSLPAGTSIGKYIVDEWGTDQGGYLIYPASNCAVDGLNKILWENITDSPGGFIRGQASANDKPFAMDCPLPANSTVDFTVAPAIGGSLFGCNLNSSTLDAYQWTALPGNNEWPTQVFPYVGQIMVSTPSKVTNNRLFCGNNNASGDPKIVSYRARPQPSHVGWSATAIASNNNEGPSKALDNNGGTRWSSGRNGALNDWFVLNLGSAQYFNEIVLESNATDYARNYIVSTSLDGVHYTLAAARTGQPTYSISLIAPVTARYIKIELTSGFNFWWSIYELNVYLAPI